MELNAEKIKNLLCFDMDVFVYESVGSTNEIAEKLSGETERPVIIVAEGQTAGRGRNGKSFYSPSGSGLYLSILTHPRSDFNSLNTVTCGASVAVVRAIEKLTNLKPRIKWVNDIYLDGRKICGILCKAVGGNGRVEHLVTGIGINISTEIFPDEIKNTAGSLGCAVDRNSLAAEIAHNFIDIRDYMDEYREKSCIIGKEITYYINNTPHMAQAVDIDKNGGLVVISGKEKTTLTGGEITVRL